MASHLKRVTTDTNVTTAGTFVKSVILTTDGTNAGSVIIRDGDNATGTAVASLNAPGAGPSAVWTAADRRGVYLADGLGVDITGTGAACTVEYEKGE